MIGPGMTSRAKQITALLAILLVLFLPKQVDCGYPGGECARPASGRRMCRAYDVEPIGLFLLEWVAGRDLGFAYSRGETCQ
jgi:hypothetical protein